MSKTKGQEGQGVTAKESRTLADLIRSASNTLNERTATLKATTGLLHDALKEETATLKATTELLQATTARLRDTYRRSIESRYPGLVKDWQEELDRTYRAYGIPLLESDHPIRQAIIELIPDHINLPNVVRLSNAYQCSPSGSTPLESLEKELASIMSGD